MKLSPLELEKPFHFVGSEKNDLIRGSDLLKGMDLIVTKNKWILVRDVEIKELDKVLINRPPYLVKRYRGNDVRSFKTKFFLGVKHSYVGLYSFNFLDPEFMEKRSGFMEVYTRLIDKPRDLKDHHWIELGELRKKFSKLDGFPYSPVLIALEAIARSNVFSSPFRSKT